MFWFRKLLVLSRNKFPSTKKIRSAGIADFMRKLNKKKIKWTIKEVERREMGVWTIAHQNGITPRWARELPKKYKNKEIVLKKPGRKPRQITKDERKLVKDIYKEYLVSATMIEQILKEKGIKMGHNRIHKIMLEEGLAKPEENKQKRRGYKAWERKHSLSLTHTDWAEYKREKFILFEDDASRFILSYGKFKHANKENAIEVFKKSLKHGIYKQLYSDNGSVFKANKQEGKKQGEADFEREVRKAGIKQIFTKIRRPQGNGKMEKLVGTIKQLWKKKGSFEEAVKHYNYKKPNWALTTKEGRLRTPYQAFLEKMRKA